MDWVSSIVKVIIDIFMGISNVINSNATVGISLLVSAGSAISAGLMESRKRRLEKQRDSIDNKLKYIFAPLKGNRLLHQASINGNKKLTIFSPRFLRFF